MAARPILFLSAVSSCNLLTAAAMDSGSSGGTSIMFVSCCKRLLADLGLVVMVGHPCVMQARSDPRRKDAPSLYGITIRSQLSNADDAVNGLTYPVLTMCFSTPQLCARLFASR